MGSIYQILFGPHGPFFHEACMLVLKLRSSLNNLLVVKCQQLPIFLELGVV